MAVIQTLPGDVANAVKPAGDADSAGHPVSITSKIKALWSNFHISRNSRYGWIAYEEILLSITHFKKHIEFAVVARGDVFESSNLCHLELLAAEHQEKR